MTYNDFSNAVKKLLDGTAAGKGYNNTGADGSNQLFDFVHDLGDGYGHALGEIVYKAKRFAAKKNPEDLLKAAAWSFLVLQHYAKSQASAHRPLSVADTLLAEKAYEQMTGKPVPTRDVAPSSTTTSPTTTWRA